MSIEPAVKNIGDPMPRSQPAATPVDATKGTRPMPTYIATERGPCSAMIASSFAAISSIAVSDGMDAKPPSGPRLRLWSSRWSP
nr:hypothetical protein [Sphingobium fuliginis]